MVVCPDLQNVRANSVWHKQKKCVGLWWFFRKMEDGRWKSEDGGWKAEVAVH